MNSAAYHSAAHLHLDEARFTPQGTYQLPTCPHTWWNVPCYRLFSTPRPRALAEHDGAPTPHLEHTYSQHAITFVICHSYAWPARMTTDFTSAGQGAARIRIRALSPLYFCTWCVSAHAYTRCAPWILILNVSPILLGAFILRRVAPSTFSGRAHAHSCLKLDLRRLPCTNNHYTMI